MTYGASISEAWKVGKGLRQGRIWSPILYNVNIIEIIVSISEFAEGYKLGAHSTNIHCYVDDMIIVATTFLRYNSYYNKLVMGSEHTV